MIEIDHKTDIIIPFNNIGEAEWDVKTRLILESLADLNDDEIAPAIDDEQILKRLGMDITSDPVFSSENLFYI